MGAVVDNAVGYVKVKDEVGDKGEVLKNGVARDFSGMVGKLLDVFLTGISRR